MNGDMLENTVAERELTLERLIQAPAGKVFQAWTNPEMLKQWFVPRPWTVSHAETDVRPGGASLIVMRDPQGNEFPNRGVYLEVIEDKRLVFTDAYTEAWLPSEKPFMTVILNFNEQDGQTHYQAQVRHWSVEDRQSHEQQGFHQGWETATDQLVALLE